MQLSVGDYKLKFANIVINYDDINQTEVFSFKNNKTLRETLDHHRYSKFKQLFYQKYHNNLDDNLGEFALSLKQQDDMNYKLFLNKYGDLTYSRFWIEDEEALDKKGLYCYSVNKEIKYIGRCLDSYKKRINFGYGKIHPKNCYIDGQATNCHLNSIITKMKDDVTFWICILDNDDEIISFEVDLIQKYNPEWNYQINIKNMIGNVLRIGGRKMIKLNEPNTNLENVYEFLLKNKDNGYCDDCLSYELNIRPRQQINQICRMLEYDKKIQRIKSYCHKCNKQKLSNFTK